MRVVGGWEREKLSRRQIDMLFACLLSSRVRPMKKIKARPTLAQRAWLASSLHLLP